MNPQELIQHLRSDANDVHFNDVMAVINEFYHYTPTTFNNGLSESAVENAAGTNEGSCKIFAFAQMHQLNQAETLACFGDFYRKDVLLHPDNDDHQNIRNFIRDGWGGIRFNGKALATKPD